MSFEFFSQSTIGKLEKYHFTTYQPTYKMVGQLMIQLNKIGQISYVLYAKLQVLILPLWRYLKNISSKFYKPFKDLQQYYQPLKEITFS